jgi:2,4-dienoyl-CoA reductase-like NADH-dependent reductase (Old Yellow Enzyme family)
MSTNDVIFEPLQFKNLRVKNRLFRSSISGRWDNYNGSGSQTRINWETKFAKGGVGAIISSFVPVHLRGRILPNYAMIDADDKVAFWRKVVSSVHEHDCKFIIQLSHGGRQRDVPGVENLMNRGLSSTSKADSFHGLLSQAMTLSEIHQTVQYFADGARRARAAGADGIELHASHGYLFTQFLSSAINDRKDEYGGSLENRARFLLDVIHAIRREVGADFHLQVKINSVDAGDALFPWEPKGNTLAESIRICKWVEAAGADALHVSIGNIFPHPQLPSGGFPVDEANWSYGVMMASGVRAYMNYTLFHFKTLRPLFLYFWNRSKKDRPVEAVCAVDAREVKRAVGIPVITTGGYQDGRVISRVLREGYCDAVSIARPLIANNDLPKILQAGKDLPEKPCSFCNRCLLNAIANPLGCYDERRFSDRDEMIREVMSVYDTPTQPVSEPQPIERPDQQPQAARPQASRARG